MAKKDKKESKIVLERIYNIPLRKKYMLVPLWRRTDRAVSAVREFIAKNMKSSNVLLGKYLNMELWKHGMRNPPHHIKVICKKDEEGKVMAELVGAPEEGKKAPKKKAEDEEVEISVKEALGGEEEKIKEFEEKEIKEEHQEKAKEIEKEEIKELKKEHPKKHPTRIPKEQKNVAIQRTAPGENV